MINRPVMQTFLSPQHSHPARTEPLKHRSPSFRSKRVPSLQDACVCSSSQNLRIAKAESPCKRQEDIRRRKSQYIQSSNNGSGCTGKKRQKVEQGGEVPCQQNIINSIQDLKEEYRGLREAYKSLMQERLEKSEEMEKVKVENAKLKQQLHHHIQTETTLKLEIDALRQQLQVKDLELDLCKTQYKQIQNHLSCLTNPPDDLQPTNCTPADPFPAQKDPFPSQSDPLLEISYHSNTHDSNFLSFSLSSVFDETEVQHLQKREHVKVVSELSQGGAKDEFSRGKGKKESCGSNSNFKKNKKEGKMENAEGREWKGSSVLNPVSQVLTLKSPTSREKKNMKQLNSTGKRKKLQEKENLDARNPKKKSRKMVCQLRINEVA